MKFWKYVVRNALRNKLRTALTILSTGFSRTYVPVEKWDWLRAQGGKRGE